MTLDWYFDFVSPFSYLALPRLAELSRKHALRYRPILFAELLRRSGNMGPAEMPAKRLWTYRFCVWQAGEQEIPFRFPATHPFNPLPYLRLAVAAENSPQVVRTIFNALWTEGLDPADENVIARIARDCGIDRGALAEQKVKDALRAQTEEAITRGVFGVPTLMINCELFWGADAMDFAKAYLADPAVLDAEEMRRVVSLPIGATRKPS
jgi:2-hydroxychromene-2-carboxylate isomerase